MAEITETTCCPPQQQTTATPEETTPSAAATTTDVTRSASKRGKLGRKLSRRLSLVTKVPNMIGVKLKSEFGSKDSPRTRTHSRHLEITVIAPDKSQRIVSDRLLFRSNCCTLRTRHLHRNEANSTGLSFMLFVFNLFSE